jgi:hypothetical protein
MEPAIRSRPGLGDWPLHEARPLSERLVVCGGMAAAEQELTWPDAAPRIGSGVAALFASRGDRQWFIFASTCNTSPRTPFTTLVAFRDAAREHGEL